jgi:hypothetical protein
MSATDAEVTTSTDNTATVSDESQAQGTAEPSESTTPTESTEVEKSIPQSQVSKLIAREKRAAAESVRAQYEQRIAEMQNSQSQSQQSINQDPSQIDWNNPNIARQLDEAIQRKASYERGQQIANDYLGKVTEAKISDPAFGELYDDLGIEQYPVLVEQLSKFDNMTDVIKELGQNPANFANILMLSHLNTANQNDSGRLAAKELNKLSNSIKANNAAKKVQQPAEPLSQMKPSHISGDGKPTIKDFKKMFKG